MQSAGFSTSCWPTKLYTSSQSYRELLDFIVRLRNFAPFNAMLLQVQKPGLRFAATASDWSLRFGRKPKEGARPLLILWPFTPVVLVYDVLDTEGRDLPQDVQAFPAAGPVDDAKIQSYLARLTREKIEHRNVDAGDGRAGSIGVVHRPADTKKEAVIYRLTINRNHAAPVTFATIAHELGHLFLGHLGEEKRRGVRDLRNTPHAQCELEAESVSFLVCARNGVTSKSETYLSNYVKQHTTIDDLDLYTVLKAAGDVEEILGLKESTSVRHESSLFPV